MERAGSGYSQFKFHYKFYNTCRLVKYFFRTWIRAQNQIYLNVLLIFSQTLVCLCQIQADIWSVDQTENQIDRNFISNKNISESENWNAWVT